MQTPDKEKAASGCTPKAASKTTSDAPILPDDAVTVKAGDIQVIRIKTLIGRRIVQAAGRHNTREIQAELGSDSHIDVSCTPLNYIIEGSGTAAGIVEFERDLLADAEFPRPLRKNSVRCVEIVFSLPHGSEINHSDFFTAATEWVRKFFNVPILSSIVHMDESAPHCHVLLLPLVDGVWIPGSVLIGGKTKFLPMLDDFHKQVASRFGLARQAPEKRLPASVRHDLANKTLAKINANHDLLNEPNVKDALLALFATNPAPLAVELGIGIPEQKAKVKTMAEIFTKNCPEKKPSPIGNETSTPIGEDTKKDHSLPCVGEGFTAPVISPTELAQTTHRECNQPPPVIESPSDDYQRIRDEDHVAVDWDTDTGDFIQHSAKSRSTSPVIEQARQQLAAMQAAKGVH